MFRECEIQIFKTEKMKSKMFKSDQVAAVSAAVALLIMLAEAGRGTRSSIKRQIKNHFNLIKKLIRFELSYSCLGLNVALLILLAEERGRPGARARV